MYSKLLAVDGDFATGVRGLLTRLLRDEAGSQIVLIALLMPILIGVGALALDGGVWGYEQLMLQSAADSAAVSAARLYTDKTSANLTVEAEAIVAQYCGQSVCSGPTVTVYNPPQVGGGNCSLATNDPYIGNSNAFEVIVTQPESRSLSTIFGKSNSVTLCARAIACSSASSGSCSNAIVGDCILALDTSGSGISINGNNVTVAGCGLVSNGTVSCSGNSKTTISGPIASVSSVTNSGCSITGQEYTLPSPGITDPYATVAATWPATCTGSACTLQTVGSTSLSPGIYSNGIALNNNNTTYTMAPGVYYVGGNGLSISGNSVTLNGNGVTIVFTNSTAGIDITKNNVTLDITAPSSGWSEGVAVWGESSSGGNFTTSKNNFNMDITGAIYMPNAAVTFTKNNATIDCTQIIAKTITLNGNNTNLTGNCSNVAGAPPQLINQSPILVE